MPETGDTAIGEAVLDLALARAAKAFGPRLEAAYALGSLAHGGFSSLVSDVDLGLILADPLTAQDTKVIEDVGAQVREAGAPLADRLSVFWGSRTSRTRSTSSNEKGRGGAAGAATGGACAPSAGTSASAASVGTSCSNMREANPGLALRARVNIFP